MTVSDGRDESPLPSPTSNRGFSLTRDPAVSSGYTCDTPLLEVGVGVDGCDCE